MLKTLKIDNIAVIEHAQIEFTSGLNILTGETGAGKSIVVDAINAILGERASKELVRNNAEYAFVSAYFENVGSEVQSQLKELDIEENTDDALLITRKIFATGKTNCKINGCPVTVSMLKKVAGGLVNIHGQHDSQALLDPRHHCEYIDMLSKDKGIYNSYLESFHNLLAVRRKLKELTAGEDNKDRQLELLNYQIEELEKAQIRVGERKELQERKAVMDSAEDIKNALQKVNMLLTGTDDDAGVTDLIAEMKQALLGMKVQSETVQKMQSKLEDATDIFEDIKAMAAAELENADYDPEEQNDLEARLQELFELSAKYGETEEEMLAYLEKTKEKRNAILYSDEELEKLNAEYDKCYNEAVKRAEQLTKERKETAQWFEKAVTKELEFLDMPKIKFRVNFEKGNLSSMGADKVEFLISANPGEAEKPLSKIASGGELSRIMLAFRNILAAADTVGTLIFDEIDTGVSGKASGKIGQKLKAVSKETQVIVVTHSAQIAAFADTHLLVEKKFTTENTYTGVTPLGYEERVHELARIMGGLNITETLLKSAAELIENAKSLE